MGTKSLRATVEARSRQSVTSKTLFEILTRAILQEDGDLGVTIHLMSAYESQVEVEQERIGEGIVIEALNPPEAEQAMREAYRAGYLDVVPDREPASIDEEFQWPESLIQDHQDYPTKLIEYVGYALGVQDGHGFIALKQYAQRKGND